MTEKAEIYKGLDNRDLKAINLADWALPRAIRNPHVREAMEKIVKMKPGEQETAFNGLVEDAKLLHSALYRLTRKHGVPVVIHRKAGVVTLILGQLEQ